MTTVGFIGLGNMGAPMAVNLAKAGYDVLAFDVVPPRAKMSVAVALRSHRMRRLACAGATSPSRCYRPAVTCWRCSARSFQR